MMEQYVKGFGKMVTKEGKALLDRDSNVFRYVVALFGHGGERDVSEYLPAWGTKVKIMKFESNVVRS